MKVNTKNLSILRDYYAKKSPDETINMRLFRSKNGVKVPFISLTNCGDCGCLLGSSPFIKGLETKDCDFINGELNFFGYAERIFGIGLGRSFAFLFLAPHHGSTTIISVRQALDHIDKIIERANDG